VEKIGRSKIINASQVLRAVRGSLDRIVRYVYFRQVSDVTCWLIMGVVNKPEVSMIIVGFYVGMTVFVSVVFGIVFYFIFTESPANSLLGMAVLVTVVVVVEALMLTLLASFYRTRYILTDTELILKTSRLIGGSKKIPLDTVTSAEHTLIPFGFRLFGASFYGGYYYFPSVGRTFMAITNFHDGVLIKSAHGNYVITPSNPDEFMAKINKQTKTKTS
jgi:membrane protein YdbS with pleckstrin-like domain